MLDDQQNVLGGDTTGHGISNVPSSTCLDLKLHTF